MYKNTWPKNKQKKHGQAETKYQKGNLKKNYLACDRESIKGQLFKIIESLTFVV